MRRQHQHRHLWFHCGQHRHQHRFFRAATEITLWTYPIGSWQKEETVNGFIAEFNKQYPDIKVNVEYLDYTNGDDKVTTAIEAKNTPDIIFEGPERLVSNWGAKGLMVDLSDLWTEEATADISKTSEAVVNAPARAPTASTTSTPCA